MPLIIRTPVVDSVLRELGDYPSALNVLDRRATAVQRQLRRAGLAGYEPETQATLMALIQLSERPAEFFDVGAHIGLYSALAAAIFPSDIVHVTAFEPTPTTAHTCELIAETNRLAIQLEQVALSDSIGTATLYLSDKAETSNSLVEGFRASSAAVDVPTTTLDAYSLQTGRAPTVLKIDVETFEESVVRGALETLAHARPSVVCELLPRNVESTSRTLAMFADLGFTAHSWDPAAGAWAEIPPGTVGGHLSHDHRDWLFTPAPLTEGFRDAVTEWMDAISACTEAESLYVPGGTPLPHGWARSHRREDLTPA